MTVLDILRATCRRPFAESAGCDRGEVRPAPPNEGERCCSRIPVDGAKKISVKHASMRDGFRSALSVLRSM